LSFGTLKGEKLLAVAVIYGAGRKAPPSQQLIAGLIENRHGIRPGFSAQGTSLVMREVDSSRDLTINQDPASALAPMLAEQLKGQDLNACSAVAYKDFDETYNAWMGALYIGLVAQA
jgi:hypothetical protein